jgi:hypothetical protein
LQIIEPRSVNLAVHFMQPPILLPPPANRRMSISAASRTLSLNVWINPVIKYSNLERRQVQSPTLPAAGSTRKKNLESGRVSGLEFPLKRQKVLQRSEPAGNVKGNFRQDKCGSARIVALPQRSKFLYRQVPQPLVVPLEFFFHFLWYNVRGGSGRGLAIASDFWNSHVEQWGQLSVREVCQSSRHTR